MPVEREPGAAESGVDFTRDIRRDGLPLRERISQQSRFARQESAARCRRSQTAFSELQAGPCRDGKNDWTLSETFAATLRE